MKPNKPSSSSSRRGSSTLQVGAIQKGVPPPERRSRNASLAGAIRTSLSVMEPGDSRDLAVDAEGYAPTLQVNIINAARRLWGKESFRTVKINDKTIRVWRL